jgi:hypothetical protein
VPCWTYTSEGLCAHKRKELVFSLRRSSRGKADEIPDDPLKLFVTVYEFVEQGRLVDGLIHYSEGGWEIYRPDRLHATKNSEPVDVKHIILITSEKELGKRLTTQLFGAYTRSVEELVQSHFATLPKGDGQEWLLQYKVSPEGAVDMKMASYPGIADEVLRDLLVSPFGMALPFQNYQRCLFA